MRAHRCGRRGARGDCGKTRVSHAKVAAAQVVRGEKRGQDARVPPAPLARSLATPIFSLFANTTTSKLGRRVRGRSLTRSALASHVRPQITQLCEKFVFASRVARCTECNVVVHRSCKKAFLKISGCMKRKVDDVWQPNMRAPPAANTAKAAAASGNLSDYWAARGHFDPSVGVVPDAFETCATYLRSHGADQEEGIFRIAGEEVSKRKKIQNLKFKI